MKSPPTAHRSLGRTLAAMCCVWLLPTTGWTAESPARPAAAPPRVTSPAGPRSEKVGDATLLIDPDALTSAVAVTAFLRAPQGTANTPPPAAGLRHLLERLLLDPSHPAGARAMQLRAQGWRVQAFTTPEYTAYQVVADRPHIDDALALVRALLCEPPLPSGREADARLAQHRQALALPTVPEGSAAAPLQRLFHSAFGDRHPGAQPIVGSPEQLASLSASALRDHWQQAYRPPALTLVLSGGLDAAALQVARSQLAELDAQITRSRGRVANPAAWPTPRATGPLKATAAEAHRPGPQLALLPTAAEKGGAEASPLWLGFSLDGASAQDLAALEVATQLGLPPGFSASLVPGPGQSPSLWVLRAPAASPTDAAESARTVVEAALRLADGVTDDAVTQARRRLRVDVARRTETAAGQGLRLGSLWLLGLDETTWQQRLMSVAAADLRRALGRFLQVERLSLLLPSPSRLSPEARAPLERRIREQLIALSQRATSTPPLLRSGIASVQPADAVAKATVLRAQSGAHVVLLPEAQSGTPSRGRLVAFTALWPGGRHREEPRQRGLHDLLVRVWPRATAALPAFRFAALSADLSLSLGAEATDDGLALRGQLPSENLLQGLALLRDCIDAPVLSEADVERARRDVVLASRRPPLRDAAPRALRSGPEIDAARFAWQLFQGSLHRADAGSDGPAKPAAAARAEAYEDLAATVGVLTTRQLHEQLRGYSHRQLVLAVVGDFDSHSVVAQLAPWLGTLTVVGEPARAATAPASPAAPAPSAEPSPTVAEKGLDAQTFAYAATQQAHLILGARVPGCSAAPASRRSPAAASTQAALSLLLELLASDSGIGQAQQALLSRRALAFTVEGIRTGCVPDSTLALYVATSPRSLDAAEASLRDELRRFLDHPPDAAALALARERLASRWVLASQRRGDRSLQLARGLLFGQADPALGDDSPAELIRKLDPETLQAVAKRYLREDRLLRAVVLPDSQRIALGNRGASLRANEPSPLSPTADSARRAGSPGKTARQAPEPDAGRKRAPSPAVKQAVKHPVKQASAASSRHAAHSVKDDVKHSPKQDPKPAASTAGKPARRLAGKPAQRL